MSKYIQSFYNYPVIFSSIGKGVPARDADGPMRNVVEITDAEYSVLERREPIFRAMVRDRKYRVLDYMPDSAKPDAERINEAKQEAKAAKAEKAGLADENARLKAEIEALKAQMAAKAEAKQEAKAAKAENAGLADENARLKAEIEALKAQMAAKAEVKAEAKAEEKLAAKPAAKKTTTKKK